MKLCPLLIQDWIRNKKRIQDRLNRIKKKIRKYEKQKSHFEMRLRVIKEYEKNNAATSLSV